MVQHQNRLIHYSLFKGLNRASFDFARIIFRSSFCDQSVISISYFFSMNNQSLGLQGESIAKKFLIQQGYFFITSRYRTRAGEIDLIFSKGGVIIFIEVKARRQIHFGYAMESIHPRKLARLYRVAFLYLHRYNWKGPWRIDVIGLQFTSLGELISLRHLRDVPP
jgi:putative endonuclease